MYDNHRRVHAFCDPEEPGYGFRLRLFGTRPRIIGHVDAAAFHFLKFFQSGSDNAVILTVYAGDAAQLFQAGEDLIHRLVVHHGVIGHIQLEGAGFFIDDLFQFTADVLIPVGQRQMEGVITGRLAVRFLVPVVERLPQIFSPVLGRIINDAGGSACQLRFRSRIKFIRCHGIAHFQRHVGVRVDKSRKQKFSPHINDICVFKIQVLSHGKDLLPFYQDIHFLRALAAYNFAAFKQKLHTGSPFLSSVFYLVSEHI